MDTTPTTKKNNETGMIALATLILVAAVANLNLSVANVALPSIGFAFDASQVQINLVAVGYSLGLAASVLWPGLHPPGRGPVACPVLLRPCRQGQGEG